MPRRRTHDEYAFYLVSHCDTISVIGTYNNSNTPILHSCKICHHEWNARPKDIIINHSGCPTCNGGVKLSHETYITQLSDRHINITPLKDYAGSKTNIPHKCNVCENVWSAKPNNILNHWGCPKCSGHYTRTNGQYEDELIVKHNTRIYAKESYLGMNVRILHHCNTCNYTWNGKPSYVLQSNGCPKCPKGYGYTDNDIIYVWETNYVENNTQVYKIGVTSKRLGDSRIKQCSRSMGLTCIKLLRWEQTTCPATLLETKILEFGKPVIGLKKLDGYTEFRALTDTDLKYIDQLIDQYILNVPNLGRTK